MCAWLAPPVIIALMVMVLLALIPLAWHVPALATLGILTAVLLALIGFEMIRYDEPRDQIRHAHP